VRGCGIIPPQMGCIRVNRIKLMRILAVTIQVLLLVTAVSCKDKAGNEDVPEPIWNDTYELYVLDPGPFVELELEFPSTNEFLILQNDGIELSFGKIVGANIETESPKTDLSSYAVDTITNENWLPGVGRWMLEASEIEINNRFFYYVTLLVRRDAEWTEGLTDLQKTIHAREMLRYPEGLDMTVRLYYATHEDIVYIMTLSGTPEDVILHEKETRELISNVRFSAVEATNELQLMESR